MASSAAVVQPGVGASAVFIAPYSLARHTIPELVPESSAVISAPFGASATLYQKYNAVSASDSELRWQISLPSQGQGVDRNIYLSCEFKVSYTPLDATGVVARAVYANTGCGLRQYPIHSVCSNARIELNNTAISFNSPQQLIHALNRYAWGSLEESSLWGGSASKDDLYATAYGTTGAGSSADPFASLETSEVTESRQLQYYVTSGVVLDGGVQSFTVRVMERLQAPLCNWSDKEVASLYNVESFNVSLALSNLQRLIAGVPSSWIGAVGAPAAGTAAAAIFQDATGLGAGNPAETALGRIRVSVTQREQQYLYAKFVSPPPGLTISPQLVYKYTDLQYYSRPIPIANFVGGIAQSDIECQLNGIPSRFYVFATPDVSQDPYLAITRPSHFTGIESLTATFDGRSGIFSSIDDPQVLFTLFRANGLTTPWLKCNKGIGTVGCLSFGGSAGIDLPNPLVKSAGLNGAFNLRVSVRLRRMEADLRVQSYNLYIVAVNDALLVSAGLQLSTSVNPLTEAIVASTSAQAAPPGSVVRMGYQGLTGGSFWSDFANGFKRGFSGVMNLAGKILPGVGSLIPIPGAKEVLGTVGNVAGTLGNAVQGLGAAGGRSLTAAQRRRLLKGSGGVETASSLSARARLLS